MTIWEAYDRYRIMPNLRLHQLRVAAVARTVAQAIEADVEFVTKAGLVHDMGNIMKADFSQFPREFYGDYDLAYWEAVKEDCRNRFGADEHAATAAIVRDMGVPEPIVAAVNGMGFSKAEQIFNGGSLELQILEYADQRVAPYGVVSIRERLDEGHKRYAMTHRTDYGKNEQQFEHNRDILLKLEERLFSNVELRPDAITEESLKDTIESLRSYVIA